MTNYAYGKEIFLEPGKDIVCRFSPELNIEYINDFFKDFSGFEIHEVIGLSVDAMKHPSIPQTINNIIERAIQEEKNINLLLKNETKNGDYYWFMTDFKFNHDKDGKLRSITYYRKAPPKSSIPAIESLYKKLVDIERHTSLEVAEKYLSGFLEEHNMSMAEYTASLDKAEEASGHFANLSKKEKKKSTFSKLFK